MNTITPNSPWNSKEVKLLHKLYANTNNDDIALIIGRTTSAVHHKAAKEGLRKSESFLNSAKSGRIMKKVSFWQRIINAYKSFAAC